MAHFSVYILYSKSLDIFYIGYTSDLPKRLDQHNQHVFKDAFTARAVDWAVFFGIRCINEEQAKKVERHIKRNKSRKYLENLKKYPGIVEKLLLKYPG